MALSGSGNNNRPLSEINVTPMVDVMLVLLIIFMVAAPLIQQGVEVDLPETRAKESVAVAENDVVLTIDKDLKVFISETEIPIKRLTEKLRELYATKAKKEIFLRADKTIPYGYVVKVMALVKNAGIDQMGMITEPEV